MKYLVLIIFLSLNVFANSIFWEQVNSIQNNFYNEVIIVSDENATINNQEIISKLDMKYDAFNSLIKTLKQNPYAVKDINNSQIKNSKVTTLKLQEKILINQKYSNDLAVQRDKIKIATLDIQLRIEKYFLSLESIWTLSDKNLENLNTEYQKELDSTPYEEYLSLYKKLHRFDGEVESSTKNAFIELNKQYKFFNDLLHYIKANKYLFQYKSLTSFLKIDIVIEHINSYSLSTNINTYLRFVYLDTGKLILFFLSISIFFLINFFVYKVMYEYLKKILYIEHDEINENILDNLDKIRRPLSYLVIAIGLKLAIEILLYPITLSDNISDIIYFFYLILGAYIINIVIDVFVYSYLVKYESSTKNIRKELVIFTKSIMKITVYFTALLIYLLNLGVNISAILASLGIGGLAVALAAQTTLSNFFGLLKIMADNSFSQGDWIESQGIQGTVVEIGFISTTIRTFDNSVITVPNSTLANSPIVNWNKRTIGRRIKMHIGVTYSSEKKDIQNAIKQIKDMLIQHVDVASEHEIDYGKINRFYKKEQRLLSIDDKYGVKSRVFVFLDKLGDSSIDILVDFFTKETAAIEWLRVKEDVIFKIWDILDENNLEFAFPSQTLYLEYLNKNKMNK